MADPNTPTSPAPPKDDKPTVLPRLVDGDGEVIKIPDVVPPATVEPVVPEPLKDPAVR